MESKSTIMPAFTICPNYDSSYNETRLQELGIPGRDGYRREGLWEGNSGAGQRGVFDIVAHKLDEIVENMEFLMVHNGRENKTKLSGKQVEHLLEVREILNPTYGRCFEVDLAKLNQTIESVSLVTFVPIYLYVNIPGQFHNGDSYSKIEVLLHECLFIELTYEILIQNDASTCRKFNESETYDECSERVALENLTGQYGCTAPYLASPPCLPICQGQAKAKQELQENLSRYMVSLTNLTPGDSINLVSAGEAGGSVSPTLP